MRKTTAVIIAALVSLALIGRGEGAMLPGDVGALIKEARASLDAGNKENTVAILDAAYEMAVSAGDTDALMEIGDLYVAADPSLREKALQAWTASGRVKCNQPY